MQNTSPSRALLDEVLASSQPEARLLRALEDLDAAGDLPTQVTLFEAMLWRQPILEYWVWYRMSRVYRELGRPDACFFCSAMATGMHPEWDASLLPYRDVYAHLRERGDLASAAALVLQQRQYTPHDPVVPAAESEALLRRAPAAAPAAGGDADDLMTQLQAVVRSTFRQPDLKVTPRTTADDVPGWDSLSHATLIMNVERAFGITFSAADVLDLEDVGGLAAAVASRRPASPAAPAPAPAAFSAPAAAPGPAQPPAGGARPAAPPVSVKPKLIFYGNCQAGALAVIFRNTKAIAARYDVVQHDIWAAGEVLERDLRDFDNAAALVRQDVRNWRDHPKRDALPDSLPVVSVPFCHVKALWPFDAMVRGGDEKMVRAMKAARLAGRDEPFGFQDGVLARLRDTVPDPEERLRRYRDLDFPDVPDLARYAELEEIRLLRTDEQLGSRIGRFIVYNYRSARLFHAIAHPASRLMAQLAEEVAGKLGLDTGEAGLATYDDYMATYQVPLHPAVIEALGLTWVDAQSRYAFHGRETVTFDDYVRRYIAYPVG